MPSLHVVKVPRKTATLDSTHTLPSASSDNRVSTPTEGTNDMVHSKFNINDESAIPRPTPMKETKCETIAKEEIITDHVPKVTVSVESKSSENRTIITPETLKHANSTIKTNTQRRSRNPKSTMPPPEGVVGREEAPTCSVIGHTFETKRLKRPDNILDSAILNGKNSVVSKKNPLLASAGRGQTKLGAFFSTKSIRKFEDTLVAAPSMQRNEEANKATLKMADVIGEEKGGGSLSMSTLKCKDSLAPKRKAHIMDVVIGRSNIKTIPSKDCDEDLVISERQELKSDHVHATDSIEITSFNKLDDIDNTVIDKEGTKEESRENTHGIVNNSNEKKESKAKPLKPSIITRELKSDGFATTDSNVIHIGFDKVVADATQTSVENSESLEVSKSKINKFADDVNVQLLSRFDETTANVIPAEPEKESLQITNACNVVFSKATKHKEAPTPPPQNEELSKLVSVISPTKALIESATWKAPADKCLEVTISKELEFSSLYPAGGRGNPASADNCSNDSPTQIIINLSTLLAEHDVMRQIYLRRAKELLTYSQSEDFHSQERVEIDGTPDKVEVDFFREGEGVLCENTVWSFPNSALMSLASVIEGKSCSLGKLTEISLHELQKIYGCATDIFRVDNVAAKIKLIATRKNYIKNPWIAIDSMEQHRKSIVGKSGINLLKDENEEYLWRWEVTVLDILPKHSITQVKKARLARRKLSQYYNAVARLLSILEEIDKLISSSTEGDASSSYVSKRGKQLRCALLKLSQEEEKVRRYEREQEKERIMDEAKKAIDAAKERDQKQKLQLSEGKRQMENKKQLQILERKKTKEELKQQKESLKLQQEKKAKQRKEAELDKQKSCLLSFFARGAKPIVQNGTSPTSARTKDLSEKLCSQSTTSISRLRSGNFEVEKFRLSINSTTPNSLQSESLLIPYRRFLSTQARQSRLRRTHRAKVTVSVTVFPDNPFATEPYSDFIAVEVFNKFKFFLFHEDVRPPYRGTWSKQSSIINGRNPFGKDSCYLDYDYDSQDDWEEGDDELGEELGDDNMGGDEDDDRDELDDEDKGWLAGDDEIDDEELDDATKLLRKKRRIDSDRGDTNKSITLCFIAPKNGVPVGIHEKDLKEKNLHGLVEGFSNPEVGLALFKQYKTAQLYNCELLLDVFPPILIDEHGIFGGGTSRTNPGGLPGALSGLAVNYTSGLDVSDDDLRCVARFIHNNTLGSREKIVEELLNAHDSVTRSRAQAFRILDSIAEKQKDPLKGTFWVVRKSVLESLGLVEELYNSPEIVKLENMRTVARFVHNSTWNNKHKIVDELRYKHELVTSSRFEIMRIIELIAIKKKHPISGYYWYVTDEYQHELGLAEVLSSTVPPPSACEDHTAVESMASGIQECIAHCSLLSPTALTGALSGGANEAKHGRANVKRSIYARDAGSNGTGDPSAVKDMSAKSMQKKARSSIAASASLLSSFLIRKKDNNEPLPRSQSKQI